MPPAICCVLLDLCLTCSSAILITPSVAIYCYLFEVEIGLWVQNLADLALELRNEVQAQAYGGDRLY